MKEEITIPGKTYAVTSANGCTVTTEDGITLVEAEAGKQGYFVAVGGKVVLSDDAAIVTQVFKLAPLLTMSGAQGGGAGDYSLPSGYKRLDYLESDGSQFITRSFKIREGDTLELDTEIRITRTYTDRRAEGRNGINSIGYFFFGIQSFMWYGGSGVSYGYSTNYMSYTWEKMKVKHSPSEAAVTDTNSTIYNGQPYAEFAKTSNYELQVGIWTCIGGTGGNLACMRRSWKFIRNGKVLANLIPARNEDGAPLMFDTITGEEYYNEGEQDFTFPSESTTYGLRRVLPDWGKLTAHGLRRLYYAPESWQGELYDYALAKGYKPIIETERPEAGYWAPRWTETAEEIVLEWVETEPPAEESFS